MSLSSDSEPLPQLKVRRVTRKVSFSHPLAYQDPQFILKRQVHESRRHTRTNKDTNLSSGLPDASRKRRTEVIVMKEGRVIEAGLTDRVLDDPRAPYTQLLVSSILQV